jgi:branched-chain amino acid transport system substrate-binding protein
MQDKSVSRREFLKLAGLAGATVSMGAGLGSLVAACGDDEATSTTTSAATTTTAPAATTTTVASTTTVSTAGELGRPIKLGSVQPITGAFAVLAQAEEWAKGVVSEVFKDGLVCGDGKVHPIKIELRDAQSDAARAAQVAGDLILNDKVDLLLGGGSPSICNPAADQAETLGCPFLGQNNPWTAFTFGRGNDGKTPFKWTYLHSLGAEQMHMCLAEAFAKIPNNKKIGFLTMNDDDGKAHLQSGTPVYEAFATDYGTRSVSSGTEDLTDQIDSSRRGLRCAPRRVRHAGLHNFWKQSLQQGFNPKVPGITLPSASRRP